MREWEGAGIQYNTIVGSLEKNEIEIKFRRVRKKKEEKRYH